jgi:outer membrane lipoprotein-sorting protein
MTRLRTISSRRLAAVVAAVALLAVTAGIAQAGLGSDPKPAPKALDRAVHDALRAPAVAGITARIEFTNGLLPTGSLPGGGAGPLAAGANGRLWMAGDGRFRLELQSSEGDAQIVSDGEHLTVYDAASKTVYRMAVPDGERKRREHEAPTLAAVRRGLDRLARAWTLSGAQPTSTGGRPTYTVRITPKDDGGLLGAGEVAWDAEKGVPLRAAVFAQGHSDPVIELEATEVSFGTIEDSVLRASAPATAEVVEVDPPEGDSGAADRRKAKHVRSVKAVAERVDFELSAPDELAGLPRKEVRLVSFNGTAGAVSTYGEGLGGIVVLQRKAARPEAGERGELQLPQINIDGATGTELATALGTVVTFTSGGVSYTVLGSVPPVAAENAARGLK